MKLGLVWKEKALTDVHPASHIIIFAQNPLKYLNRPIF